MIITMMKRRPISIKTRLIIRFSVLFLALFVCVQGIMLVSFRSISIDSSKARAMSSASMILDALTSFMLMGGISKRDLFFEKIMDGGYGIEQIRVLRGKAVSDQFGPPKQNEIPQTDLEFMVLKTGELQERIDEDSEQVTYNLVIPYKAIPSKSTNCIGCHNVREGDLLGAVSITYDLTPLRHFGLSTLALTALSSFVFVAIMLFAIYRFFIPYNQLFEKLSDGFRRVSTGIFAPIALHNNENSQEHQIAENYNSMVGQLSDTLMDINFKAGMLVGNEPKQTGNVLSDTKQTVDSLLDVYSFKRIIEKDESKEGIYGRLMDVIEGFNVLRFSIYEVDPRNEKIRIVNTGTDAIDKAVRGGNGTKEPMELIPATDAGKKRIIWCHQDILERATECRAMRTGSVIDSTEFPNICPNFRDPEGRKAGSLRYRCMPLYTAGKVGNIIQFVFDSEDREIADEKIPLIECYFREAASVLEGKTFMELMRQQTLVDQLTGMYNRRFLDEIAGNIQASVQRRATQVGILMIDVDFFKKVNDEHGHNVGDIVLERVAGVIKESIRTSDLAIRYGGEEILALLMDVEPQQSQAIAEKIRGNIESEVIEIPSGVLKKTVSIGMCEYPTQARKFWQSIKYADLALYRAKENGRNQVVVFSEDLLADSVESPSPSSGDGGSSKAARETRT